MVDSRFERLPAALFLAGAGLLGLSVPLPWTEVHAGPFGRLHQMFGYQENPIAIFVLLLTLPTILMLYRRWYAAGPRALAVAATLLVVVGLGASYVDINSQAVAVSEPPIFLAGFVVGAVAVLPFVAGTLIAFRLGDD